MDKEEFINSKIKLSKEDIIEDYYKTEEELIKKLGIEHKIYELEQQVQKQKEVIDKAIEYIKKNSKTNPNLSGLLVESEINTLLDILKEVSE